ncbi:MAG: M16 family metallopeptidase [Pseudomonadota bacterium]
MKGLLIALATLVAALPARAAITIEDVTSPGGIRAWLVEDRTLPFVALELRFLGGSAVDPPGKRGAVNLMAGLLEEGAGELDARAFAEAREALAAGFSFGANDDAVSVSARFLTENRDASVELLRKALVETRFDQDAIDRVRGQVLSSIESDATSPGSIAGRAFDRLAFGDHPYATSSDGTPESVAGLTRGDLVAARDAVLARDRVYVAAVGDIDAATLGALLDRLLGALPAEGAAPPGRAPFLVRGGVTVVDYASPQSTVVFGQAGIARDDPDFFAAFVLNQILGGSGFTARLMAEVREKRGLTYGISTALVTMQFADVWQGSFSSSNDKVAETVKVVRDEWARAAAGGVTDAELSAAKTYLTGAYPLRFDGNGPIAGILVGMQMQGLPIDYVTTRNAKVEAVTTDDVRRVAARLMSADALRFVVVGRPEGLASTD